MLSAPACSFLRPLSPPCELLLAAACLQVNGTANILAMEAAKEAGVPRFAFISVHDYKLPAGWQTQNFLLRG